MLPRWFVSCSNGLQGLLKEELDSFGVKNTRETVAGVEFRDDQSAAYRVCLWSRLANRVFLPLTTFPVEDSDDLYDGCQAISWAEHFDVTATIAVDFVGTGPGIDNTQYGAQRVKDAVVDYFRARCGERPSVQIRNPDIRLNARFARGKVVLSLDFSGESLHRRGYRRINTRAPLKENLAAALLVRAGWPDQAFGALIDPMCGSGTLLIEAAMMAADIAPGLARSQHGFDHWRGHRPELWQALLSEAETRRDHGLARGLMRKLPSITGYDQDEQAVRATTANIDAAGLNDHIRVHRQTLTDLTNIGLESAHTTDANKDMRGLVICNPPYGARMGEQEQLKPLYGRLGEVLKAHFGGWRAAVFSANETLCFELGLRADKQYKLFNGALPTKLLLFDVYGSGDDQSSKASQTERHKQNNSRIEIDAQANQPALSEGAMMLVNRLRKNQRKLRGWLRSSGIECYRFYDADLPEYAVAIDCYGEAVHIQEYAPPATIDAASAERHIDEVRQAIMAVLQPSEGQQFFKLRQRQRGEQQYQRRPAGAGSGVYTVRENSALFEINLSEYLDTGLFLDHRPVRKMLGEICAGKRFLNLFCYTASATVSVALGGATESLSIDMSNTYLDWAKRNFTLNKLDVSQHRLLREDCLTWLAKGGDGTTYDVIFLDPPTFSNSRKMADVLDIQKDHESLIRQAIKLLTEDGLLVFSTNLRRFKMAEDICTDFVAKNISAETIDRDFARRANIHQCWSIRNKPKKMKLSGVGLMADSGIPKPLILYTGIDCHLCEQAKEILDQALGQDLYETISITGNEALTEDYGLRIPVVLAATGQEKSWPFTAAQIKRMMSD